MINTATLVSAIIQVIIFFGAIDPTNEAPLPPTPPAEQTTSSVSQSHSLNRLTTEIDEILANPLLQQAQVGVKIVSLKNGKTLYSYNADKLYVPASVMKVITTSTALVKLKPEYRFRTALYTDAVDQAQPHSRQNLYLKGFGDPTLRTHHLSEMVN
ncbi:MAG: hypothetical protein GKR77_03655, partial [Legionellales bacterium]|nr:hypothetical protein [Legionellales bacterium]